MLIFPFNDSILVGCIGTSSMMNDGMSFQILLKIRTLTIIAMQNLNLCIVLSFNHFMKILKQKVHFIFSLHQAQPCHSGTIINKSNKPEHLHCTKFQLFYENFETTSSLHLWSSSSIMIRAQLVSQLIHVQLVLLD